MKASHHVSCPLFALALCHIHRVVNGWRVVVEQKSLLDTANGLHNAAFVHFFDGASESIASRYGFKTWA